MSRPSAVTWLLLLLVLVPTGVLAWLGFRAADGFDAADQTRLDTELELSRTRLTEAVGRGVEQIERDMQFAIDRAAATLAAEGPDTTVDEVIQRLRAAGVPVTTATLLDARGRVIWPVEHVPEEGSRADPVNPSRASLLAHLRRSADLAYYGEGGLAGAERVWIEARDRFRSRSLKWLADVEAARLRARSAGTAEAAAEELGRLQDAWGSLELVPGELGRPILLLHVVAAPVDKPALDRLTEFVRCGQAAAVPLTAVERERLARTATLPAAWNAERTGPSIRFEAPVTHGARLRVTVTARSFVLALKRGVTTVPLGKIHYDLAPEGDESLLVNSGILRRPGLASFGFPLPGGAVAVAYYAHREAADVRSRRQVRRLLLTIGVAGLFLITLLGLGLTRRAMARERAARRMRDEFIANVTHEVRTPLTSVLLHSEMLAEDDVEDARRRDYAKVVKAQGKRLAQLVDDMLDFAALERGTRTIEAVPVDLGAAAREAVAPFLVLAERDGVEATCEVRGSGPDDEVAAMGDPAALARVLGNLLGNAWKHGRPARNGGPGRIRVLAFEDRVRGEGRPTVEVRDDGPGIPHAERATIFQRFGRGRGAKSKEGAGIGLSLSRDLALAMGGDLDVRDEDGETVFRLRLPQVPELEP